MKRAAFLAVLGLLSACGGGSGPVQPPPNLAAATPAWTLVPGAWQEYQILRGEADYDQSTGCLTPIEATLVVGEVNRNTNLAWGSGVARVYSPVGVAVTSVPYQLGASLLEASDSTGRYVGEAGNYGAESIVEPEPMVTRSPVVGERLSVESIATTWAGVQFPFETQYYTKQTTPTVIGCLVESPEGAATAYTMEYDGELLQQVYGQIPSGGGPVQVTVARRIRQGSNGS